MNDQIEISRLQESLRIEEKMSEILKVQKECGLSVWSAEDYRKEIQNDDSRILVAENSGKISGFVLARKSIVEDVSEVDILNFGVFPVYQKLGIGKALWDALASEFFDRNVKSVWLEVRESNNDAIKFYKNRGFVEIQIRKNFYTYPTENALLMKLAL